MSKEPKFSVGDIVYITMAGQDWMRRSSPKFNIPVSGRVAKLVKILDWKTEEGKLVLEARRASGNWADLDPKDFKYVLNIYYPELSKEGLGRGVVAPEVMPLYHPGKKIDKLPLFQGWPDGMWEDLNDPTKTIVIKKKEKEEQA